MIGSLFTALRVALRPMGRESFVNWLPRGAEVLDVGCGNNSPAAVKKQRPDLYYVGLDVADYQQDVDPVTVADEYVISTADTFAESIKRFSSRFDAIISSHNIEHCNDQSAVLAAMAGALVQGGLLYMAWPAEHTIKLPSRRGCLNFFDDPTHKKLPNYDSIIAALDAHGVHPVRAKRAYRPIVPYCVGALCEPVSRLVNRPAPFRSTWAFYGFESVVWFRRS